MSLSWGDKTHVYSTLKEWAYQENYEFVAGEDVTQKGYMLNPYGEKMTLNDFVTSRKTVLLGILLCIDYQLLPITDIVALDSAIITLQADSPTIAKLKFITEKLYSLIN